MNPSDLAQQLGIYGSYASLIIVICASIVNQYSEEKRVKRAEEILIQKQNITNNILNESDENITNMDTAIKEVENETETPEIIADEDKQ